MTPSKTISAPATGGSLPKWVTDLPMETLGELGVPLAVLAIVIALITPLPGFVLDLLIVTDILMSVMVMMVSLYLIRPVEFSSFPTTLLLLDAVPAGAEHLVFAPDSDERQHRHLGGRRSHRAFGSFVVGGNYIIGAVIFLVLIAIQYVVINHGAVRISEVTARFTLDALPGKQMSIDSRSERRADRRSRSQAAAQGAGHGSRVLRRHGRRLAVHAARRGGQHPDHGDQHHRRVS